MSEFAPALSYILDFEDPRREYAIVPDAGGYAISGVNSKAWPIEYNDIADLPQPERPAAVAAFYLKNFWTPLRLAEINSQDIANRVMDATVNMGPITAVRLLQTCMALDDDGIMGPITIARTNADAETPPGALLNQFRSARAQHYRKIVANDPSKAQYLAGWLKRAQA